METVHSRVQDIVALQQIENAKSEAQAKEMLSGAAIQINYIGGRVLPPGPGKQSWRMQAFYKDEPDVSDKQIRELGMQRVILLPQQAIKPNPRTLPLGAKEARPFRPIMQEDYYEKWNRLHLASKRKHKTPAALLRSRQRLTEHENRFGTKTNPALPYRPGCQVRVFQNQFGQFAVFVKQRGHWDYYSWNKTTEIFRGVMDPGKMRSMRSSGYHETENVPDDLFAWIQGLFCKQSCGARKNPINSLATYYDSGYKAGQASRRHDQGMVSFQQDWSRRAFNLEAPADRTAARAEWDRGYREGSGAGERPHYFR